MLTKAKCRRSETGLLLILTVAIGGCATASRVSVRAERCHLDVRLDPARNEIAGRATIDVVRADDRSIPREQPVAFELLLHPALEVKSVRVSGAEVLPQLTSQVDDLPPSDPSKSGEFEPRSHWVFVDRSFSATTLFVEFSGRLFQDAAAGERPGEIHNFEMRAHIGEDGIYLADGYWYPQPRDLPDRPSLSDFTLTSDLVPGFTLVASGETDSQLAAQTGRLAWRSPFRLPGMVLVGGRHEVHTREHNGISISLHLKPEQASHVDGLFTTVQDNLDRYEPLIGKYPASEYRVVDNFFSSGFAFPTFTLLSSAVIDMGERSQNTHGYIDHEMLHSWWGNAIHVDPGDGNWCEALASYGANYYGFVLDGDAQEARRKRRNFSHFLSRMRPEDDKPLGTFGRDGGAGRSIGYDKGAMVFHMLAWIMGQESFWSAMREFSAEYAGKYASWADIQRVCEKESGQRLTGFFEQWVRRGGAPRLIIQSAKFDSADQTLDVALHQGDSAFDMKVPIRVVFDDHVEDFVVPITEQQQTVQIPVARRPTGVELDPDYHLFRKVPFEQIIPTTASTRFGNAFISVLPTGGESEAYQAIQENFASSFETNERLEGRVGHVNAEQFADRCVLILGAAANDPYIAAYLSAIQFPVQFSDAGFVYDGVSYGDPDDAILCTVAHPRVPGGGITVVYANSDGGIPGAFAIPMYDRSVVVFKGGRAVVKKDLEQYAIVPAQ